jgi:hypothetical protein
MIDLVPLSLGLFSVSSAHEQAQNLSQHLFGALSPEDWKELLSLEL